MVWYRNGRIFSTAAKSTVTITHGLLTVNNITLESLSRDDVHTKLTCQTTNFEATTLRSSVELDMKCMLQYLLLLLRPQTSADLDEILKFIPFIYISKNGNGSKNQRKFEKLVKWLQFQTLS